MGSQILNIILRALSQYILSVSPPSTADPTEGLVVMGNIGQSAAAGGDDANLDNKVVVSLVNLAEESALKNKNSGRQVDGQHHAYYPTVHVNLYLLFTANFSNYETAVNLLFRIMEFFQGTKVFRFRNLPVPAANGDGRNRLEEMELMIDLHTLSFEQLNDLWGSLGGKQLPFVLYRARLIPIQMEKPHSRTGLITEFDLSAMHN